MDCAGGQRMSQASRWAEQARCAKRMDHTTSSISSNSHHTHTSQLVLGTNWHRLQQVSAPLPPWHIWSDQGDACDTHPSLCPPLPSLASSTKLREGTASDSGIAIVTSDAPSRGRDALGTVWRWPAPICAEHWLGWWWWWWWWQGAAIATATSGVLHPLAALHTHCPAPAWPAPAASCPQGELNVSCPEMSGGSKLAATSWSWQVGHCKLSHSGPKIHHMSCKRKTADMSMLIGNPSCCCQFCLLNFRFI